MYIIIIIIDLSLIIIIISCSIYRYMQDKIPPLKPLTPVHIWTSLKLRPKQLLSVR